MSRLARKPILVPSGVKVELKDRMVSVEGPRGRMATPVLELTEIEIKGGEINVKRANHTIAGRAQHGTMYRLLSNMAYGVSKGFQKSLAIEGVGFRSELKGPNLVLHVGFTHAVEILIPEGLSVKIPKPTEIVIEGVSKGEVGQFAARVRGVFEPEPYKGKGIRYMGEVVRRKAGKAVAK